MILYAPTVVADWSPKGRYRMMPLVYAVLLTSPSAWVVALASLTTLTPPIPMIILKTGVRIRGSPEWSAHNVSVVKPNIGTTHRLMSWEMDTHILAVRNATRP